MTRFGWGSGLLLALVLSCSSGNDPKGGAGGRAGSGAAGTSGSGAAGKTGSGGSTGTAGHGGSTGSAGKGDSGGSTAGGGSTGTAGRGGSAGGAGKGGSGPAMTGGQGGGAGDWHCLDAPGELCFCHLSATDTDPPTCSSFPCCVQGSANSCECADTETCATLMSVTGAKAVARCPPP
jgi:hypothetical protein